MKSLTFFLLGFVLAVSAGILIGCSEQRTGPTQVLHPCGQVSHYEHQCGRDI